MRRPDIVDLGRQKGLSGKLESFSYSTGEVGNITISGPFSVNKRGLLSGTFELKLTEGAYILTNLARSFPDNRELMLKIAQGLKFIAGATDGVVSAKVDVKNGKASLGIIPLGDIKPLY